ncbi:MAG: amidohydrolase family protein [Dehalococcoidia bacterium]|jgi:cytosine/adenosine deaminase-related metal-dependent hydrolase
MAEKSRMLIKGGTLVTMDPTRGVLKNASIFIEDGIIMSIGPNLAIEDAEVIDAQSMIIMPGFVDCHRHMWQSQLRAITANWSLYDYSARIRSVYSSFYDADDAYLGTYAGFLEALNAGVTTIVDHSHIMNTPEHADEVVRAFTESGMRGILCYGMYGNAKPEERLTPAVLMSPKWHYDDARRIKTKYFNSAVGHVQMGIALTEADFFPMELSQRELGFAREIGAKRISAHVGMGAQNKWTRYIERLNRAGLMGEDILFIHGWSLTDYELKLCAKYGAAVINTPETELQMGMGYPVTWRLLSFGGRTGIGIDIVSNQSADMFTQIRLNMGIQRALQNDALYKAGRMPKVITPTTLQLLEIATIKGAEAIGLDKNTGSLTPGKEADLIMLRTDDINMFPVNNPVNSIIMAANVGNIDTVMIRGRVLKKNGKLVGVDIKNVMEKLLKSQEKIIAGGAMKGFAQGEAIMNNVFPLNAGMAFMVWLAAMVVRSPFKKLQDAFIERATRMVP